MVKQKPIYKFGRNQCRGWIGTIKEKKRVAGSERAFYFFLPGNNLNLDWQKWPHYRRIHAVTNISETWISEHYGQGQTDCS